MKKMQLTNYIETNEEIDVSDYGYSQAEIETLIGLIETNAQDALESDMVSKKSKEFAVEVIQWIRSVHPNSDSGEKLSADSTKKLLQLKKIIFDTEEYF